MPSGARGYAYPGRARLVLRTSMAGSAGLLVLPLEAVRLLRFYEHEHNNRWFLGYS
jgi:hypothetical protein